MADEPVAPGPAPTSLVGTETPPTDTPPVAPAAAPPADPQKVEAPPPSLLDAKDVVLPEGMTVDEPLMKELVDTWNKPDLSQKDRVNALVGLHGKIMTKVAEAQQKAWNDLQDQWQKDVMADPTLGGKNWPAHDQAIGKLLDRFGTPKAREAFAFTGAGNNPEVVRFLANVAKALNEPGPLPVGQATVGDRDAANVLFGSTAKAA